MTLESKKGPTECIGRCGAGAGESECRGQSSAAGVRRVADVAGGSVATHAAHTENRARQNG